MVSKNSLGSWVTRAPVISLLLAGLGDAGHCGTAFDSAVSDGLPTAGEQTHARDAAVRWVSLWSVDYSSLVSLHPDLLEERGEFRGVHRREAVMKRLPTGSCVANITFLLHQHSSAIPRAGVLRCVACACV